MKKTYVTSILIAIGILFFVFAPILVGQEPLLMGDFKENVVWGLISLNVIVLVFGIFLEPSKKTIK